MPDGKPLKALRYSNKFRPYQADAIAMVRRYSRDFRDDGEQNLDAALVCHPTGTGKTAVLAGLTHAAPEIGNVLVLTTREAIRNQLVRELSGEIFVSSSKFALSDRTRLTKICFGVTESQLLLGSVAQLYAATANCLPSDHIRQFSDAQYRRLAPQPDMDVLSYLAEGQAVLVLTVQMLVRLYDGRNGLGQVYDALCEHVDLVVFDEGHYEPAARFSAAVRELRRPTVLMTATPFRNDLKAFRLAPDHVHLYRYNEAVEQRYIRDVEVVERAATRDPGLFCADVIDFCTSIWGPDIDAWTQRVIVRCDDVDCVTRLGEAFMARGFAGRVIGIHDRYADAGQGGANWQYRTVPPPSRTNALIWIHQFKLLEGIDDHRFQVVALFNPTANARALVQQVGRVIRTASGAPPETAFVLDHFTGRIGQQWDLYRAFDAVVTAEALTATMSRFYLDALAGALPEFDYIERRFRRRLDLLDPRQHQRLADSVADEVLFSRAATLRQVPEGTTLDDVIPYIEAALRGGDYEYRRFDISAVLPNAVLYLCARVRNVDFLNTLYFPETQLEARMVVVLPEHRLLASTNTAGLQFADGLSHLPRYDPARLERILLPGNDNRGRVNAVASKNTNLGKNAVRRREVHASSIADTAATLEEHDHVISKVAGYNGAAPRIVDDLDYRFDGPDDPVPSGPEVGPALLRRSVSISNGNVSEYGPPLRLHAFGRWVQSLIAQMHTPARYDQVFSRYAPLASQEVTPGGAVNLLLDLTDLAERYYHRNTGECLIAEDVCADRSGDLFGSTEQPSARFLLTINDTVYAVIATYHEAARRYRLDCPELDEDFIAADDRDPRLLRAVNDAQAFTVVPERTDVMYVHGGFYVPGLKFGADRFDPNSFPVGHLLYPSKILKDKDTEKGGKVLRGNNYAPDSLFSLIDSWKNGFDSADLELDTDWAASGFVPEPIAFTPTVAICDDMGAEVGDFILADSVSRRVVLVHAKASDKYRPSSASALQEICAQAQKNTTLLASYSPAAPPNIDLWNREHKFNKLVVRRRIRKPTRRTAQQLWANELDPLLRNPLTSREIWLVVGNMLSASTMVANLRTDRPAAEVLQMNQLLHSTMVAAAGAKANLRIFCAP